MRIAAQGTGNRSAVALKAIQGTERNLYDWTLGTWKRKVRSKSI